MFVARKKTGRDNKKTLFGLTKSNSYYLCLISAATLAVHCVLWEAVIAPIRPHHFWLSLKSVPIILSLFFLNKRSIRSFQATTLLVWLYIFEGLSRSFSDISTISKLCALIEIFLSLALFAFCIAFVRLSE
ncbi:DUF2069 domain-containing protein [Candidatus Ichthyocystis hellenicum]|uniref:DUF2069 domain-containing protein n=1 Tax=Candidatus Ichthyocystis hellenicum TaxID=1561003 RepID=UPI000B852A72